MWVMSNIREINKLESKPQSVGEWYMHFTRRGRAITAGKHDGFSYSTKVSISPCLQSQGCQKKKSKVRKEVEAEVCFCIVLLRRDPDAREPRALKSHTAEACSADTISTLSPSATTLKGLRSAESQLTTSEWVASCCSCFLPFCLKLSLSHCGLNRSRD